ncbi:THO complex subunit 4 [Microdochium nivale]|nr:THO complex subunit 4 [Microdochium nivale]
MDRSLDEIVAESQHDRRGPRRGGGGGGGGGRGGGRERAPRAPRHQERDTYPRDGVRKSTRDDSRDLNSDWVHDKFDDSNSSDRPRDSRRRRESPGRRHDNRDSRGSKIRVENIHYELTEEDLEGLFTKIGPILKLDLLYDRAGRSEGVAYVTYEHRDDAEESVRQFDRANAKGQPIRLSIVPPAAPRRNPFDGAHMPSKPLSERISRPRSLSPGRDVDRYVPGGRGRNSRSPLPGRRERGGRRPGARREGGNSGGESKEPRARGAGARPKKTQEELDAEMANYFNGGATSVEAQSTAPAVGAAAEPAGDDVDMNIE